MVRTVLALLTIGAAGSAAMASGSGGAAWPHRAIVTGLHGRPAAFEAFTLGGDLIVEVPIDLPDRQPGANASRSTGVRPLTAEERLRGVTPRNYVLNLANGPVVFVATGAHNLRLVVCENPCGPGWAPRGIQNYIGSIREVAAEGRRFTVRLVANSVVIEAR